MDLLTVTTNGDSYEKHFLDDAVYTILENS